MQARINREMFSNASHTPRPDPSDSEDIRLALETARALEAEGDAPEAARWIRRAVDHAEKEGNDERVLVLARAAAELTSAAQAAKETGAAPSSVPTLNVRGRGAMRPPRPEPGIGSQAEPSLPSSPPSAAQTGSIPPMLAALISSIPPFSNRPSSKPPQAAAAPPAPAVPSPAPTGPANDVRSTPADKPITERTMRIGSIRVAITGSIRDAKSFSVERLEKGESLPAGAMEAMLVLTGEIDGSLEFETHLRVAGGSAKKP
jgi:hypothetical protein